MDKTGQKNEQASKMPGLDSTDTTLESKLEKLGSILSGYGKMTVALSGGVDSAFLLCFAYKIWHDDRIAALTACPARTLHLTKPNTPQRFAADLAYRTS